jgi:para-aminobenzoate synthetase component I
MRLPPDISRWDNPAAMTPLDAVAAWPVDRPLAALHSGRLHERWARWSILASPTTVYRFDGRSRWMMTPPPVLCDSINFHHDPLTDLDQLLAATRIERRFTTLDGLPFRGGWIGAFSYDLGRVIEPTAGQHSRQPSEWPLIELAWCSDALIFDHLHQRWWTINQPPVDELDLSASAYCDLGPIRSRHDPDCYTSIVGRALRDIAAGDIFQANLAQHFDAPFTGSPRALFCRAMQRNQPWYGAYLDFIDGPDAASRCAISLSPELFLEADLNTRKVLTRPIKGTRPASCDPGVLRDSAKDAAELHMIIDLMRNDLGRVCDFGTVRVTEPRIIETHPTVHHGVGEVVGRLRPGTTFADLLRATFPPGSVTGAPKIRAMQIIDRLEGSPRNLYCGSVGCLSDDGYIALNVAIRTMLLSRHRPAGRFDHFEGMIDYAAGAGIVSDSDPLSEYRETLDKAAALRALVEPCVVGTGRFSL